MTLRNSEQQPPVCLSTALNRVGGDRQILIDIAGFFLEDVPTLLEEIQTGIDTTDAELSARRSHTVKGLCANFDALACVAMAQQLEHACLNKQWQTARDGFHDLRGEVDRVIVALKSELPLARPAT